MNELTKHLGLYYHYAIEIRSLLPNELRGFNNQHPDTASYFKKTNIHLTSVPVNEEWKYRYGFREQYIWKYNVTVYG